MIGLPSVLWFLWLWLCGFDGILDFVWWVFVFDVVVVCTWVSWISYLWGRF